MEYCILEENFVAFYGGYFCGKGEFVSGEEVCWDMELGLHGEQVFYKGFIQHPHNIGKDL